MNLFPFSLDPFLAAQQACDSYSRKICMEALELLGYAYVDNGIFFEPIPQQNNIDGFPFLQHFKHPMGVFVRKNQSNFNWCLNYARALLDEYTLRYNKKHSYEAVYNWILANPISLNKEPMSTWPRCFGKFEVPRSDDVCVDYQNYFKIAKQHLAKWTKRPVPTWFGENNV
jgi:hypothetical protein